MLNIPPKEYRHKETKSKLCSKSLFFCCLCSVKIIENKPSLLSCSVWLLHSLNSIQLLKHHCNKSTHLPVKHFFVLIPVSGVLLGLSFRLCSHLLTPSSFMRTFLHVRRSPFSGQRPFSKMTDSHCITMQTLQWIHCRPISRLGDRLQAYWLRAAPLPSPGSRTQRRTQHLLIRSILEWSPFRSFDVIVEVSGDTQHRADLDNTDRG